MSALKVSEKIEKVLRDEEKLNEITADIEIGTEILLDKFKLPKNFALKLLKKKLEEKYQIPFDIKWYYANYDYSIRDKLYDYEYENKEIDKFIVHIHVDNDDGEENLIIETLDEVLIEPYLEKLKENMKKINRIKFVVDERGLEEDIIFDKLKCDIVLNPTYIAINPKSPYKKELRKKLKEILKECEGKLIKSSDDKLVCLDECLEDFAKKVEEKIKEIKKESKKVLRK